MREFGEFRFDLVTGELWRGGRPIKLQPILARLLAQLIARPNELVEREELAGSIWPPGTFVGYENSLNNAVARLRRVIGAEWIEVVPKRGYRFRDSRKFAKIRRPDPAIERACYLGRHFWNRTTATSLAHALVSFEYAITEDPSCADAWAGLADTYLLLGDEVLDGMRPDEALDRAHAAALRALDQSSDCVQALAVAGMVAWRRDWNWRDAERYLRAAIAVDKHAAKPRVYFAWLLRAAGRSGAAEMEIGRALELDPVSSFVSANAGLMLYFSRRYSDAIEHLRGTLVLDPYYALAYLPLGLAFAALGKWVEAVESLNHAVTFAGDRSGYYRAVLAYALAASGHTEGGRIEPAGPRSFERALVHLGLNDSGASIDCLEMALSEQSSHLAYLGVDPIFDPLRQERRFRRLAKSIGLP